MRNIFNIQSDYAILIAEFTKDCTYIRQRWFSNREMDYLLSEISFQGVIGKEIE